MALSARRSDKLGRVKILHLSDLHFEDGFGEVPMGALLNKRLVGLGNLWLRRRRLYRDAPAKIEKLTALARELGPDLIIITGDFTALGTEAELHLARRLLDPLFDIADPIVLPGNHDVYLHDGGEARFEAIFRGALRTDLQDLPQGEGFPRVRLFDGLAVITFETARPNPEPWLSSGAVPTEQLRALRSLSDHMALRGRRIVFATHYAPFLEDGSPDHARHGIDNREALIDVLRLFPGALFLHGHVHRRYHVRVPELPIDFFCSGSSTMRGREGFFFYELNDRARPSGVRAIPGAFFDGEPRLEEGRAIILP